MKYFIIFSLHVTIFLKNYKKLLTFARTDIILYVRKSEVSICRHVQADLLPIKKTKRLEIRLAPDELELIEECSKILNISKTEVINKGVKLVKAEINK